MKIAVICWAGRNNQGDERMLYCIKRYFHKHTVIPFETWSPAESKIDEINACDYVLFGGGTLIRRNFNDRYDFLNKIVPPIGCIGITIEAQKIYKNMRKAVDLLIEKAEFFYVRDFHSKKVLHNHPKIIVGPDITFLYPFPILKPTHKDVWALNVLDWHWWDAEIHSVQHKIFSHLDTTFPLFKKLYPGKKWDLDDLIRIVKSRCRHIEPFALYFDPLFISGDDLAWKYFKKKIKTFSLKPLKKSRYLISMRYHGLLFACQTGIPFISLSYERKNANFCKDIGLPSLTLQLSDYRKMGGVMNDVEKNYEVIRQTLLFYRTKANKDAKYIFETIESFIEHSQHLT